MYVFNSSCAGWSEVSTICNVVSIQPYPRRGTVEQYGV